MTQNPPRDRALMLAGVCFFASLNAQAAQGLLVCVAVGSAIVAIKAHRAGRAG